MPSATSGWACPPKPTNTQRLEEYTHAQGPVRLVHQPRTAAVEAPAGTHDLARRAADVDGPEPDARQLAQGATGRHQDIRHRHHRRADRHLRAHASSAPASGAHRLEPSIDMNVRPRR